jgi:hypothetical protein
LFQDVSTDETIPSGQQDKWFGGRHGFREFRNETSYGSLFLSLWAASSDQAS